MLFFAQIDAKRSGGTGIMVSFMWRTVWIWSNCVLLVSKCHHFDWKNSWADRILGTCLVSTLKASLSPRGSRSFIRGFCRACPWDLVTFNLILFWTRDGLERAADVGRSEQCRCGSFIRATCGGRATLGRSLGPEAVGDGGADM
jgi:hypothetical protein